MECTACDIIFGSSCWIWMNDGLFSLVVDDDLDFGEEEVVVVVFVLNDGVLFVDVVVGLDFLVPDAVSLMFALVDLTGICDASSEVCFVGNLLEASGFEIIGGGSLFIALLLVAGFVDSPSALLFVMATSARAVVFASAGG